MLFMYSLSVMCMMQASLWWSFWIFLEMMAWSLMLMNKKDVMLKFLVWQSMSSLFLFYFFVMYKSWMLIWFLLMFKMAVPPFHSWLLNFMKLMNWKPFILFTLSSKIPLMILLSQLWVVSYMMFFFVIIYIFFKTWVLMNMKMLIWCLCMSDLIWLIFCSKNYNVLMIYSLMILLLTVMIIQYTQGVFTKILIFLSGIPFFSLFNLKVMILSIFISLKFFVFLFINILYHIFIWTYLTYMSNTQNFFFYKSYKIWYFILFLSNSFWIFFY